MSDTFNLGTLSFGADTKPLLALDAVLQQVGKTSAATAAEIDRMVQRSNAALAKLSPSMRDAVNGSSSASSGASGLSAQIAAQTSLATAVGTANTAIAAQTTALGHAAKAHGAHGAAAYSNRLQMLELAHVGRALFDEMAAGGNIFRGLAMEGGRLQVALSTGEGGLGGTFTRLASGIGSVALRAAGLINPFTLGATAIVGFGATALLAASHVRSLREEMDRAVSGVGHATGLSGEGLSALAASGSPTAGLSIGAGRGVAQSLAATGRLDPSNISGVMGLTRGYAAAFGTDYPTAGQQLGDIFSDPVKGADKLNERLGFLDDRTRRYIQTLRDQGDQQGAVKALIDASSASMNEQAAPSGVFDRLQAFWSKRNAEIEGAFAGPTAIQRYQHDALFGGRPGGTVDIGSEAEDIRHSGQLRKMQQDDVLSGRLSLQAGGVVSLVNPDAGRYRDLQDQQKLLTGALGNPDVAGRMAPGLDSSGQLVSGASLLADTLAKVNDRLANFMSSTERQTLSVNASILSINAWTLGEKLAAATAQEMASLGVRQIKTADELVAVQSKQAEIIARANDQAFNLNRDASDELSIAGKFGLDRSRAEIRLKARDYRATLGDLSGGSDLAGIGSSFLQGRTSVSGFSDALDGAAKRLGSFPGAGAASSPYGTLGGFNTHQGGMATPAMIAEASARTGMPASIIAAIGQVENGGRLTGGTTMLGSNGKPSSAWGFGQLTNGAARDVANVLPGFDKYDPATAVLGSAAYLKIQTERHGGSIVGGLQGYGGTADYPSKVTAASGFSISPSSALGVKLDTSSNIDGWESKKLAAANINTGESIINSASNSLSQRVEAFDLLTKSVSKTTGELARYNETMTLQNALDRAKVEISPKMRGEIDALGGQAADLAKKQDQQKSLISTEDSIRSFSNDSLDTLFSGLAHGKSAGGLLKGIGENLGESLLHSGVGMLTGGLFGKSGQAGGGFFGNLLDSLIPQHALGTNDAPGGLSLVGEKGPELVNLPAHAQVISNTVLAGMRGGAAGGHTFNMGDTNINVQGDVSEQNRSMIAQAVAHGQQQQQEWIVRNLPQIQSDAGQTAGAY